VQFDLRRAILQAMAGFNRDRRPSGGGRSDFRKRSFGDRPSFGGRPSRGGFSDRGRSDREMFNAVCSNCGKDCQVPFSPTSGKPVFCSDCFEAQGGGSNERRPERRGGFERPRFGGGNDRERRMFDAVCDNCGKDCQIPFQPRNGKPVFCSNCFEKNESGESSERAPRASDTYAKDFASLNAKLDKILSIIAPEVSIANEAKEEITKVAEEVAVAAPEKKKRVSKPKAKVVEAPVEIVSEA
jgi:CxxC-x17-CxxC domain-containing protein